MDWKEIAEEYEKEIQDLHGDIEKALTCLEKRAPKSYQEAIAILNRGLEESVAIVRLIKRTEPYCFKKNLAIEVPKVKIIENIDAVEDLFLSVKD